MADRTVQIGGAYETIAAAASGLTNGTIWVSDAGGSTITETVVTEPGYGVQIKPHPDNTGPVVIDYGTIGGGSGSGLLLGKSANQELLGALSIGGIIVRGLIFRGGNLDRIIGIDGSNSVEVSDLEVEDYAEDGIWCDTNSAGTIKRVLFRGAGSSGYGINGQDGYRYNILIIGGSKGLRLRLSQIGSNCGVARTTSYGYLLDMGAASIRRSWAYECGTGFALTSAGCGALECVAVGCTLPFRVTGNGAGLVRCLGLSYLKLTTSTAIGLLAEGQTITGPAGAWAATITDITGSVVTATLDQSFRDSAVIVQGTAFTSSGGAGSWTISAFDAYSDLSDDDIAFVDPDGEDYRHYLKRPVAGGLSVLANAVDQGIAPDLDYNDRPIGDAYDIGPYEFATQMLLRAEPLDGETVEAEFTLAPVGADAEEPSAWTLEALDGVSDVPEIESAVLDGETVTLGLASSLTAGGLYRLTAPQTIDDLDLDLDVQDFVWAPTYEQPSPEGFIEAWTGSIGDQIAQMAGRPRTRLRASLDPDATEAFLESGLGLRAGGGLLMIGPELVEYSSAVGATAIGLTRAGDAFVTYAIGTPVVEVSRQWSSVERAWASSCIGWWPDDMVDALARDVGTPRPLVEMSIEDVREYARTLAYLDRQTWYAVWRVLRQMFRWASLSGASAQTFEAAADGVRRVDVPTAELAGAGALHDRTLRVGEQYCRIRTWKTGVAADQTTIYVEAEGGPFWQSSSAFADATDVEWELLAYRIRENRRSDQGAAAKLGLLEVHLHVALSRLACTYLLSSGLALAQGRLQRGKVLASASVEGVGGHPLYLSRPYRTAVRKALEDVVSAWCEIEVVAHHVGS